MEEIKMTIDDIRLNFGKEIADECNQMKDGEICEFPTATYGAVVVRCDKHYWGTTYWVHGEQVVENALVWAQDMDYGIEM
jgi:hypothetical protein